MRVTDEMVEAFDRAYQDADEASAVRAGLEAVLAVAGQSDATQFADTTYNGRLIRGFDRLVAEVKRRDEIADLKAQLAAEREAGRREEREACLHAVEAESEPASGEMPVEITRMVLDEDTEAIERVIIGAVRATKRNIAAAIRARGEVKP